MSVIYLFYENNNLRGIFDDKKILKEETVKFILNYHIQNKIYRDKKDTIIKLKSKLQNLYKDDNGFLENNNNTWSIVCSSLNQIQEIIKSNSYATPYTKLTIKGKTLAKKDLCRDLAYIEVESLYTKK
jgi:hypothetical protein